MVTSSSSLASSSFVDGVLFLKERVGGGLLQNEEGRDRLMRADASGCKKLIQFKLIQQADSS